MSALRMSGPMDGQVVSINPSSEEAAAVARKCGNRFWLRHTSGSGAYLIPIVDGVPRVADFIIVPHADIVRSHTSVGYRS